MGTKIHIPAEPKCLVCGESGRFFGAICEWCDTPVHVRTCAYYRKRYNKEGLVERWYECKNCVSDNEGELRDGPDA